MFVINGRIKVRSAFEDTAKQMEAGLGPIVGHTPGFRGYYIVQTDDRAGEGVFVFDKAQDWEAVRDETTAWFVKNISPLCEGEPLVTSGDVIVTLEPPGSPGQANAGSGAEARPH